MNKVKLGEVLKIKHGFAFKSENYVDESKYALVTLANISPTNNFQFNREKTTFYGASFPDSFVLKDDDLIMPLTEQVVGLFGNTAFVPKIEGITFVLNQRVGKVVPVEGKADKYYLHYLLSTDLVKDQLEYRASGTRQRNISPDDIYDVEVFLPDINTQKSIGKYLYDIERKVNLNHTVNDNLEQQVAAIYDYWFTQFDFPNDNGDPYCSSRGQMVWNDTLQKNIPERWKVQSVISNRLASVIKPGIEVFDTKTYLATADVKGTTLSVGTIIDYGGRESRANMQPSVNSVWFAKMKNSIKHLNLNKEMQPVISNTILSTGFCGLQCSEESFEYIASYIANPYFEIHKDMLAHGATQKAVNNDDLAGVHIIVPNDAVLHAYHEITQPIYAQISKNICENQELVKLRDWLLPMLMNGQATISN